MQKMICIPKERYNQMMKIYDEATEELRGLKEQLITDTQGKGDLSQEAIAPICSLFDSEFRISEAMLKYVTDDAIAVFRSVCKMIRERSISDDIK